MELIQKRGPPIAKLAKKELWLIKKNLVANIVQRGHIRLQDLKNVINVLQEHIH